MKNKSAFDFELTSAITAHKNNTLLEWTIKYLDSDERNKPIADHVRQREIIKVELVEYPLDNLKRVEGPQNGELEPEPLPVWDMRVNNITNSISNNFLPEPLIVTDFWDKLEIADGNHRHEALLKSGYKKYWTIFLLTKEESAQKVFAG